MERASGIIFRSGRGLHIKLLTPLFIYDSLASALAKNSYPMGHEIYHQMNKTASWLRPGTKIIARGVNGIKASVEPSSLVIA